MLRNIILITIILLLPFEYTFAQNNSKEIISNYQSDIEIQQDASIVVKETITVEAKNIQIKHGIYRDFPTKYQDKYGNTVNVGFKILDIMKNDISEPYHLVKKSNGVRIYIGHKNLTLSPGTYTYQITYQVTRELGFFENYDELYWNVTGNDWIFPIEHLTAIVQLLPGSNVLQFAAYTGPQGAKGQDVTVQQNNDTITFNTTRTLQAHEGLTIAVAWPKGFVQAPTKEEKINNYIQDNINTVVCTLLFVVIFFYYIVVWFKYGKDPRKGTIIPLYEPPMGLSPASICYIMNMGWGTKKYRAFTAALIDMAVRKVITICEKKKKYSIEKINDNTSDLHTDEVVIFKNLLKSRKKFEFKSDYHSTISQTLTDFTKTIEKNVADKYFISNTRYFIGGILLTLLFLLCMALSADEPDTTGFMIVWLSGWTLAVFIIVLHVIGVWKKVFAGALLSIFGAVFITLFSLPFIIGELFGLNLLATSTSKISTLILCLVLLLNFIFFQLLKQPTTDGRLLMDKIEGFKMFLSITEQERFKELYPPDITPEVFEKYLPYAIALNIENAWCQKCEAAIGKTEFEAYQPAWYVGTGTMMLSGASIAQSLGSSLSGAISSSSSAPGSSSGSGGGGSSGGGGGGGGGGGW